MNTFTVARWAEDLDWIADVDHDWCVRVVQKSVDLPNVGREPTSFLWSIVDMYEAIEPDDHYAFVQGNPFPHCMNLLELLGELRPPVFAPLSHASHYISDVDGMPHHAGLDVGRWYERITGRPMQGHVTFWPGGQFMVSGRALLCRRREWWADLFADLMGNAYVSPWSMERLWPTLFAHISQSPVAHLRHGVSVSRLGEQTA